MLRSTWAIGSRLGAQPARQFARTALRSGDMFCMQCEQTKDGAGCTEVGVCGKTPEVAALQDLLVHALKGIGCYADAASKGGVADPKLNKWVGQALFSTLTNVNFDADRFKAMLKEAKDKTAVAEAMYKKSGGTAKVNAPTWNYSDSTPSLVAEGKKVAAILDRRAAHGADLAGLQELCMYAVKGVAAYAEHASQLGNQDAEVGAFVNNALAQLSDPKPTVDQMLGLALKAGEVNLKVMAMLDGAHTSTFGDPTPHAVNLKGAAGKAILVSGHDLGDLNALLEQTKGKGINVYTHGEMLPAHGYPELRKHEHLKGHFGGAWQNQNIDFALFPGPILMTSNCIIEPRKTYKNRIFSTNSVGWEGVAHVKDHDYKRVIDSALAEKGFTGKEKHIGPETVLTGFGHKTVLSLAGKVVDAVKAGHIKHFFFIGGCDGSEQERSYFRDVAVKSPENTVILTAGCGKFRFNKLITGEVPNTGIPRVLDVGQCNDSYGAAVIAIELAKAFGTDVNGLPLSFAVSWFEQKAVAVLCTLLHLGVQDIRLGPKLPAFLTPATLGVLVDKFHIKPTGDAESDLKLMLQNK